MTAALALAVILQTDPVKADIDLAVRLWKEFKMPIPPSTALPKMSIDEKGKALFLFGMVDYRGGGNYGLYTGSHYTLYAGSQTSKDALDGYEINSWDLKKPLPIGYRVASYNLIRTNGRFHESTMVSTAVQCACLGNENVARMFLSNSAKTLLGYPFDNEIEPWTGAPLNNSLAAHTAFLIYLGCLNAIIDGPIDRRAILEKLIALEKYHLIKKGPGSPFSNEKWDLRDRIKDLQATVNQPSANGNPIQAAVNDLINETKFPSTSPYDNRFELIPRCKQILSYGMKAVPYLAAEIDQPRLTRVMSLNFGNGLTRIVPVKAFAVGLIRKLSTDELSNRGIDKKDVVLAWYKGKTSGKMGNYLLSSLIEPIWQANDYNSTGFKMMIRDYPELLPVAIEQLRTAKVDAEWGYYDIASSKLSKKSKLKLLLQASRGSDFLSLKNTVGPLRQVDVNEADNLLTRFVRTTPSQLDSERVDISEYMLDTNSPAIWKEFRFKVKLASPEMRMLLLGSMNRPFDTEAKQPVPRAAIVLLHEYFDDSSVPPLWKGNKKHEKWFPWFDQAPTFGEVALESAARLMGLIGKGKPTPDQWRQFREKIEVDLMKP
ncbi:MAG: hypothetical protein WCI55_10200 [Armatimonadota bacterium]